MKRVVLYADDFEPITVIDLSEFAWDMLNRLGYVRVPVESKPSVFSNPRPPMNDMLHIVTIKAEKLVRGKESTLLLFTNDEESALMLKAAFLPGQRSALQDIEWNAFAYGFKMALKRMGDEC